MKKITIIGDIICDKDMIKSARKSKNEFDFNDMFSPLKDYFKSSDYVLANIDSTIGNSNYTKSTFSFCTPSSFLDTLKNIGVNALSIANNHILDRDYNGIEETIKELDKRNIKYFGINNKTLDIDFDDIKLSILGYTDATNYHFNRVNSELNSNYNVNKLKNTNILNQRNTKNIIKKLYFRLNPDFRLKLEKLFNQEIPIIVDNKVVLDDKYLMPIKDIVSKLKSDNRYVIMYPHIGGQYNIYPGNNTKSLIKYFKSIKCDDIIITHPHVIQNTDYDNHVYSIGSMITPPTYNFVRWDTNPEYSIVLNYYFNNNKLESIGISFLICVSDSNTHLKVYPFYDFYNQLDSKNKEIYKKQFDIVSSRVLKNIEDVKEEYIVRV